MPNDPTPIYADAGAAGMFAVLCMANAVLLIRIVSSAYPTADWSTKASIGIVIFWSVLVVSATTLTLCSSLTPVALYFSVAAGIIILYAVARWSIRATRAYVPMVARRPHIQPRSRTPSGTLHAGADLQHTHTLIGTNGATHRHSWLHYHVVATLGAVLVAYGLLRLPSDWDSLAYHMPIVTHWIQRKSLLATDCAFWYVPANNELLSYWVVGYASGDYWIGLSNVLPICLLGLSLTAISKGLDFTTFGAAVLLALTLVTQPIFRQLVSTENDVAVCALFLSCLHLGIRYHDSPSLLNVIPVSLAAGLLAGIKYYALGYTAAALAVIGVRLLSHRRCAPLVLLLATSFGSILVLSGFWYIRNWAFGGSPLYPKGILTWEGPWDSIRPALSHSTVMWSGRREVWPLLIRSWFTQLGPATAAASLALPVVLLALWRLRRNHSAAVWWLLASAAGAMVYAVTPNVVETVDGSLNMLRTQYHSTRLGLPALTTSLIASAVVIKEAFNNCSRIFQLILLVAASFLVVMHSAWQVAPLLGVGHVHTLAQARAWPPPREVSSLSDAVLPYFATFAGCVLVVHFCQRVHSWHRAVAVMLLPLVFAVASHNMSVRWHREFDGHFAQVIRSHAFVEVRNDIGAAARLCVCDYRYYPALGSYRQHFACRPGWVQTPDELHAFALSKKATHVLVALKDRSASRMYMRVPAWVEQEDRYYALDDAYDHFRLYRVTPTASR